MLGRLCWSDRYESVHLGWSNQIFRRRIGDWVDQKLPDSLRLTAGTWNTRVGRCVFFLGPGLLVGALLILRSVGGSVSTFHFDIWNFWIPECFGAIHDPHFGPSYMPHNVSNGLLVKHHRSVPLVRLIGWVGLALEIKFVGLSRLLTLCCFIGMYCWVWSLEVGSGSVVMITFSRLLELHMQKNRLLEIRQDFSVNAANICQLCGWKLKV